MSSAIQHVFVAALLSTGIASAQVPQLINYQGRVAVGTANFEGQGRFKFALVNADGTTSHWSNDGSSVAGSEPTGSVTLTVTKGLYSVLLGDTTLQNMAALPVALAAISDTRLRVWFNDDINGFQLLTPDQRLTTAPYALIAGNVPDGAITSSKFAAGAVGHAQLADGAVGSAHLAANAVQAVHLAPEAVTSDLRAAGQFGVPSGGLVLSTHENAALVNAGYIRIGATTTADAWHQGATRSPPTGRVNHTAVWTGSEMIVWGASRSGGGSEDDEGARYDPATNRWRTVNPIGGPVGRTGHAAVWTGNEMVVWGGTTGFAILGDGARYDPATDLWTLVNPTGAPAARSFPAAVWTGTEMIVWGGFAATYLTDGGRYDPVSNTWAMLPAAGAPTGRTGHTMVWTGSETIVWGGTYRDGAGVLQYPGDAARYNPAANAWIVLGTAGAPVPRALPTMVWTGSEAIVWGGINASGLSNEGSRYNPSTDTWKAVTLNGAPSQRRNHTGVWSGSEMVVWGGQGGVGRLNDGARYNPLSDSWRTVTIIGAPTGRREHQAVWTGTGMIVWGGLDTVSSSSYPNDVGRYDPLVDAWAIVTPTGAPSPRHEHSAVWTGSEMIVWGGSAPVPGVSGAFDNGGRYDPAANSWSGLSAVGAPASRFSSSTVWTGSEMIVWGGFGRTFLNDGARYNPASNSWAATSLTGAPAARQLHSALWTGSEMIVLGGYGSTSLNDGGRYKPGEDSWATLSETGAPSARFGHTAVWTGREVVIWGGFNGTITLNDGGLYNPETNSWAPLSLVGAPSARSGHTSAWTGSEMIVWGGGSPSYFNTGGRYDPAANTWADLSTTGVPAARSYHTAVWTGSEMIVWGGYSYDGSVHQWFDGGGRYDPAGDRWTAVNPTVGLAARAEHTAVWTGSEMIVWGGTGGIAPIYYNDTFRYTPGGRVLHLYQRP